MSDERLRGLERRWRESGAPSDELRYISERLRQDVATPDVLWRALRLCEPAERHRWVSALLQVATPLAPEDMGTEARTLHGAPRSLDGQYLLEERSPLACPAFLARRRSDGEGCQVLLVSPPPAGLPADPDLARQALEKSLEVRHPHLLGLLDWRLAPVPCLISEPPPPGATPLLPRLGAPWARADALGLVGKLAGALAAGHDAGLVHGDLSAVTMLLSPGGEPLLAPFGRHPLEELLRPDDALHLGGVLRGPLHYFSPEEVQGRPVTQASDVFRLGVLLHELLAGQAPFAGEGAFGTLRAILLEQPRPLPEAVRLEPDLAEVCRRALARRPEERFPHAAALSQALRPWSA